MPDPRRDFWHPPFWKWIVFLVLVGGIVLVSMWKPSMRPPNVELLPFTNSPPAWDGSYPYVVISMLDSGSDRIKFESSIVQLKPTVEHSAPVNEFQVDLHWGMFVLRQTDLFLPDRMPLALERTYRPWDSKSRAFGPGTNHPYDICPTMTRFPYTYADLNLEDGRQVHFRRVSKGTSYADAVFRHENTSSEFYGALFAWNGNGWTLDFRDGRRFLFPEAYWGRTFAQGAPFEMRAINGDRIQLKRDARRNLMQLISPSERTISFKYDDQDRIVEATDDAGNIRKYAYDANGYLETVSDSSHLIYRFKYEALHFPHSSWYLMTAVMDGKGHVLLQNVYKARDEGRISEQKLLNGEEYRYDYIYSGDKIAAVIVQTPTGEKRFSF